MNYLKKKQFEFELNDIVNLANKIEAQGQVPINKKKTTPGARTKTNKNNQIYILYAMAIVFLNLFFF